MKIQSNISSHIGFWNLIPKWKLVTDAAIFNINQHRCKIIALLKTKEQSVIKNTKNNVTDNRIKSF